MNYHNHSHEQAITDLFPEHKFVPAKFESGHPGKFSRINIETKVHTGKWKDPSSRRKFFEELAEEKKFDPYEVRKWYTVTNNDVRKKKVSMIAGCRIFTFMLGRAISCGVSCWILC